MTEYIKREEAVQALNSEGITKNMRAHRKILAIPTADVAEVRYGHWEEHDQYICNSDDEPVAKIGVVYICSVCGRAEERKEPYCHCGAKMNGGKSDA